MARRHRLTQKWALTIAYSILVIVIAIAAALYSRNLEEHKDIDAHVCELAKNNSHAIDRIATDVALTLDPATDADTIRVLRQASRRASALELVIGDCSH